MPYMQTIVLLVLGAILVQFLKPYPLRKWLGLALLATGLVSIFKVGEQQVLGFDLELLALLAVPLGVVLFLTRRRFTEGD
jgi:energy-converting hydrogenase Eha subunit C